MLRGTIDSLGNWVFPSSGQRSSAYSVILSFIILIIFIPLTSGYTCDDEEVPKDHYLKILTFTTEGDVLTYSVEVDDGSRIDVYFLNESQSNNYINGLSFIPNREHIGILSAKGAFRIPDDQDYLFVIDNMDNEQENDTVPEERVVVDVEVVSSIVKGDSSDAYLFRLISIPLVILLLGFAAMKGDSMRLKRIRRKRIQEAKSRMVVPPFVRSNKEEEPSYSPYSHHSQSYSRSKTNSQLEAIHITKSIAQKNENSQNGRSQFKGPDDLLRE